jgi:hypothetical protein
MSWLLELSLQLSLQRRDTLSQSLRNCLRPVALAPGQVLLMGRKRACDIVLPSPYASRFHARVWHDREAVWFLDLESRNGAHCQRHSHPHLSRVRGATRLEIDDLVRIVDLVYVLTARFPVPEHWRVWSNGTIPALARAIQCGQDWGALPILADALEDAGSDNEELLRHFRELPHKLDHCAVLTHLLDGLEAGPIG